MSENVMEPIRSTVQDFLAPELKTHGVRLDSLEKRIDEVNKNLEHRIDDAKEILRAEIRASEAKLDSRMSTLDNHIAALEGLIRGLIQQVTFEAGLRERVASLEARLPKQ